MLIAGSESQLQELLNTVVDASLHRGLSVNIKKTQWMVISKTKITPTCHIHNETIKQVEKFKYHGSTIKSDGTNDAEIKIRIGMAKDAFQKMEKVIKNKNITIETRNRILQCYVIPILTYGSECWTISPNMERKLEATEMWFHRRMLHISEVEINERTINREEWRTMTANVRTGYGT